VALIADLKLNYMGNVVIKNQDSINAYWRQRIIYIHSSMVRTLSMISLSRWGI